MRAQTKLYLKWKTLSKKHRITAHGCFWGLFRVGSMMPLRSWYSQTLKSRNFTANTPSRTLKPQSGEALNVKS